MEFLSIETNHHILRPIGYGLIEKYVKRGAPVRSAAEQFTIQRDATEFVSEILYVPKPINLNSRSYTMEFMTHIRFIPEAYYSMSEMLLRELIRFTAFMIRKHYFINSCNVYYDYMHKRFIVFDFSQVGFMEGTRVRFPHDTNTYSIDEADIRHGTAIVIQRGILPFEPSPISFLP
jgi:hypothetical protein